MRGTGISRRIGAIGALAALVLAGSASPAPLASAQTYPAMQLSGPFPLVQQVSLSEAAISVGDVEDYAKLTFRLDAQPCNTGQPVDAVQVFPNADNIGGSGPGTASVGPAQDCSYAYQVGKQINTDNPGNASCGDLLDGCYGVGVALPDGSAGQEGSTLQVTRYSGNLVRVRIGGTGYLNAISQGISDVVDAAVGDVSDIGAGSPLGGAMGIFGPGSSYGAGDHPFDTSEGDYPEGLQGTFTVNVTTPPQAPDGMIGVYALNGPSSCAPGQPATFSATVGNNSDGAATQPFALFMEEVDPTTNTATLEHVGSSPPQASYPYGSAQYGIPITMTFDPGPHTIAVFPVSQAAGVPYGYMNSAWEFPYTCGGAPSGTTTDIRPDLGNIPGVSLGSPGSPPAAASPTVLPSPTVAPTAGPLPDLYILKLELKGANGQTAPDANSCQAGDTTVTAHVHNDGAAAAGKFSASLTLDGNPPGLLANAPGLDVGKEVTMDFPKVNLSKGSHALHVVVNPDNAVAESNTNNNTFDLQVTCK